MIRLAKSLPKPIYRKPAPKVEPVEEVKIDPPSTAANQETEIELLTSIQETLNKEDLKEAVEVSNFPEIQKVEVLNFPDFPEQKECKHEIPEFPSEISVNNLPEIQKVEVLNPSNEVDLSKTNKALQEIEEALKKLKFNRDGELKTTAEFKGSFGGGGRNVPPTGQTTMQNSLPVTIASDQTALPVSLDTSLLATGAKQDTQIASLASILSELQGILDVAVTNTVTVQATNLDVRDLAFATDTVDVSGSSVTANPTEYIVQCDDAGSGIIYVGKAVAGTATSASTWQIFRLDESSTPDFTKLFADGVSTFTKVWDSRSGYTYS